MIHAMVVAPCQHLVAEDEIQVDGLALVAHCQDAAVHQATPRQR